MKSPIYTNYHYVSPVIDFIEVVPQRALYLGGDRGGRLPCIPDVAYLTTAAASYPTRKHSKHRNCLRQIAIFPNTDRHCSKEPILLCNLGNGPIRLGSNGEIGSGPLASLCGAHCKQDRRTNPNVRKVPSCVRHRACQLFRLIKSTKHQQHHGPDFDQSNILWEKRYSFLRIPICLLNKSRLNTVTCNKV